MKKIILPTLFFLFSFLLISCGEISISESNELSDSDHVIKWFDCLNGDEMVWDDVKEYNLEEFPGVTFRWRPEQMEAVIDKEVVPLYEGMPIWSAYFCDLTGDGIPELCSTLSSGSGMIDNRIIIYDYAGGASYELSDGGILTIFSICGRIPLLWKSVFICRMKWLNQENWCFVMIPSR